MQKPMYHCHSVLMHCVHPFATDFLFFVIKHSRIIHLLLSRDLYVSYYYMVAVGVNRLTDVKCLIGSNIS